MLKCVKKTEVTQDVEETPFGRIQIDALWKDAAGGGTVAVGHEYEPRLQKLYQWKRALQHEGMDTNMQWTRAGERVLVHVGESG